MDRTSLEPSVEKLCQLYRTMQIIRQTEEELARCHQRGLIHGACHTYVGEEAIASGVCAHLSLEDRVFSTHRGHGHALAKGVPPRQLIAERVQEVKSQLPPGMEPRMGPIATGLGEIFLWTVEAEPGARTAAGLEYTGMDLRTIQDWIVRPQLKTVPGGADGNRLVG